jgi:hypothetical protein
MEPEAGEQMEPDVEVRGEHEMRVVVSPNAPGGVVTLLVADRAALEIRGVARLSPAGAEELAEALVDAARKVNARVAETAEGQTA